MEWLSCIAVQSGNLPIAPGMASADAMGVSYVVMGPEGPEASGHCAAEFEPSGLGMEACF